MTAHDFVPNPWPRDECDAKVSDDGRNTRQCGRPAREHAKPKTAEERVKELEANARSVAKAHADEIAGLRTELDAERQQVTDAREQLYETTEAHNALVGLNTPLVAALGDLVRLSVRNDNGYLRCLFCQGRSHLSDGRKALVHQTTCVALRAERALPSESPPVASDPRDGCGKKHLGCHCALCRAALERPDPPASENPQGFRPPPDWRAVATALVKLVYTHVHGPKIVDEVDAILQAHATKPPSAPCPIPSSVTGAACLLEEGHPPDSPNRFHRYAPPAGAEERTRG